MIRSDYSCERCETAGTQTAPFECVVTPGKTPACPECGKRRWVRRLYSANISSGMAKRVDAIVEPTYEQAAAPKEARLRELKRGNTGIKTMKASQIAGELQAMGQRIGAGKAEVVDRAPSSLIGQVRGREPMVGRQRTIAP